MRKKAKGLLATLLAVIMLISAMVMPISAASTSRAKASTPSISEVSDILNAISYSEYVEKYGDFNKDGEFDKGVDKIVIDGRDYSSYIVGGVEEKLTASDKYGPDSDLKTGVLVPSTGKVSWDFTIDNPGNYIIEIEYCQEGNKTNSIERVLSINGDVPFAEARTIVLSKVWTYASYDGENKTFDREVLGTDKKTGEPIYGNDIRPTVVQAKEWVKYAISDSNGYYSAPFQFYFGAGKNTITMESQREPVIIHSITIRAYDELPSYQDYLKKLAEEKKVTPENNTPSVGLEPIQAETPDKVSAVTMYPVNDRTSAITMGVTGDGLQSSMYTKYNTAGKEKWQNIGEWMTYTIDVKESGFYSIAVRYKQSLLSGMYVSRRVYIDGNIPFEEANNCRFPYTSSWQTTYLNNGGDPFQFYLEKGKHEIKLEVSLGEMGPIIQQVSNSLNNINNCYLEILKLTGSTPDANRTYGFARVMPDVLNLMSLEATNLQAVYDTLVKEAGGKGEKTSTIEQVYILLSKMAGDESQIAGNLSSLKSQIGSLGTWINSVKSQPLQVDSYTIQPSNMELPRSEANFFGSFWFEIKLFFASFVTDYSSLGQVDEEGNVESIEVWVVTGRDQAQIIRNLINNNFTPESGISVNLKLVSANTLLPSVLANVGPDVSLMEGSTMIIDYAIRDAVIPLNKFMTDSEDLQLTDEDKAKHLSDFPEAAMVPLTLYDYDSKKDKTFEYIYGLPDSLSFSMMFYRKDVLQSLKLEIPQTWDDMLSILPILQYNNMEIGIQNDVYTFIYQSGFEAYKDHGMSINFDDTGVLNAFTKLCNMYTQYSLPYTFDFANRFRTGEMPIGISAYTTCNQLAIFASELSGLWGFVPLPGYEHVDENGEKYINNDAIATVTGCVMLTGCDDEEASWEFMKWYTGAEFQVAYSDEIVSIVGIASRPATANRQALEELPWTAEEAANILEQFDHLSAVPNNPGSYYLARYVNFAFLAAYNDGKDPADALMGYVNVINDEISRKRMEFKMEYIER